MRTCGLVRQKIINGKESIYVEKDEWNEILNSDYRIDELNKKREVFSNDVSKVKRYKFKLKEILKMGEDLETEKSLV